MDGIISVYEEICPDTFLLMWLARQLSCRITYVFGCL